MTHAPETQQSAPGSASSTLKRGSLGTSHLVVYVVAAAAPLTVSAGFFPIGYAVGGTALPATFLIAGLTYLLFSVGYTAMSRYVDDAGAFSAYIRKGLGPRSGSAAAAVAWVAYFGGQVGFVAAAGAFASAAIADATGVEIGWLACALIITVAVAAVSLANVAVGARVAAVLLTGEVVILAILCGAIWMKGAPEGFTLAVFDPSTWPLASLGASLVMAFVVFIGFEQTAIYREEARSPRKTIPRATYLGVTILTLIYTISSWTILMALGPSDLDAALGGDLSRVVPNLNSEYVSPYATIVMEVLVITSFIAGVLALQNASTRYLFSMGRQGILPRRLASVAPNGSPRIALSVQFVLVVIALLAFGVSGLDPYTQVVYWANTPTLFGVLILAIFTTISVIIWFGKRTSENLWTRKIAPIAALIMFVIVFALVLRYVDSFTGVTEWWGNALILSPLLVAIIFGLVRANSPTVQAEQRAADAAEAQREAVIEGQDAEGATRHV